MAKKEKINVWDVVLLNSGYYGTVIAMDNAYVDVRLDDGRIVSKTPASGIKKVSQQQV